MLWLILYCGAFVGLFVCGLVSYVRHRPWLALKVLIGTYQMFTFFKYKKVQRVRKQQDYPVAIRLLEDLLRKRPNDPQFLSELILAREGTGDMAGVIEALERLRMIAPLDPQHEALLSRARKTHQAAQRTEAAALRKAGDLAGAHSLLDAYLATYGDAHDVLRDLGILTFQRARYAETVSALERAQALHPLGPAARLVWARAYLQLADNSQASGLLQDLAARPDVQPAVLFHLAQARDRLGARDEALQALQRLQDAQIEDPKKWVMQARGYTELQEHDKAFASFEQCEKEALLTPDLRVAYGRAALRIGQVERAEEILSQAQADEQDPAARLFHLRETQKKAGKPEAAQETLRQIMDIRPNSQDSWYTLGRIQREIGNSKDAATCFKTAGELGARANLVALELAECDLKSGVLNRAAETLAGLLETDPNNSRANFIYARVLARQGVFDQAKEHFEAVIRLSPRQASAYRELAMICTHADQQKDAEHLLQQALEIEPNSGTINADLAAIYLENGRYGDARQRAQKALEIEPDKVSAQRVLTNLAIFDAGHNTPLSLSICAGQAEEWTAFADEVAQVAGDASMGLRRAIEQATHDWIVFDAPSYDVGARRAICDRLRGATDAVLCAAVPGGGRELVAVSAEFAREALAAFDGATPAVEAELPAFVMRRGREIYPPLGQELPTHMQPLAQLGGEVFLISSSGHTLFGGAEHFLRGMAQLYRGMGFRPVLVGHRGDSQNEGVTPDGIAFLQLRDNDEQGFRQLLLERAPTLLHVVTGSGPFVLRCTQDLEVAIVYGTHFWREMLRGSGWFPDIDQMAAPKKEFTPLLLRNEAVYANSAYTQEMQYTHHTLTTDVLYSLPTTTTQEAVREGRDIVLLVNARPEKGFDLLLQVAARCPTYKFVAIAGQSAREEAQIAVQQAGLDNLEIIDQVEDMAALYQRAWCVMVPSYRFIETFSRVVIEAHRFGVPVIGSNRGNVPLLLAQSGVALPEQAELWAKELTHLQEDPAYWAQRAQRAVENSERYEFADQVPVHARLVRQALRPVLVAVGNGIGNIIQCTPAIRRLSEHLGQPVDIVINQDFPGCEWLFAGSPYVGMVYGSDSEYMRRRYDLVLVLASFGKAVPQFHAKRTFIARHKIPFEATENMHESQYNLDCLVAADIGLTYQPEDVAKYFVRDQKPTGLGSRRIVLHAGGKPGEWEVKRWPLFEALAKDLMARGWEVISTGMPHEYVAGTVDRTGTPLVETLQTIGDAGYVIANDSGLMHVADGIGVPLTALFGPTSVVKNGPLSPDSQVISPKNDCCPCQFTDRFKTCTGMQDLSLEEVRDKVLLHLETVQG